MHHTNTCIPANLPNLFIIAQVMQCPYYNNMSSNMLSINSTVTMVHKGMQSVFFNFALIHRLRILIGTAF